MRAGIYKRPLKEDIYTQFWPLLHNGNTMSKHSVHTVHMEKQALPDFAFFFFCFLCNRCRYEPHLILIKNKKSTNNKDDEEYCSCDLKGAET